MSAAPYVVTWVFLILAAVVVVVTVAAGRQERRRLAEQEAADEKWRAYLDMLDGQLRTREAALRWAERGWQ